MVRSGIRKFMAAAAAVSVLLCAGCAWAATGYVYAKNVYYEDGYVYVTVYDDTSCTSGKTYKFACSITYNNGYDTETSTSSSEGLTALKSIFETYLGVSTSTWSTSYTTLSGYGWSDLQKVTLPDDAEVLNTFANTVYVTSGSYTSGTSHNSTDDYEYATVESILVYDISTSTSSSGSLTSLTVSGDGTISGDLSVSTDLDVDGKTTLDNTTVDGTLTVNGTTNTDYLTVDKNASVTGNLDVDGTTTLDNTRVDGTFTVNGTTTLDNTTVDGTLTVNGTTNTDYLTVDNDASVSGDLDVDGTTSLDDTTVDGTLTVNGTTDTDTLIVSGSTTLGDSSDDTLVVNATSYFSADVTIGSEDETADLYVYGNETVTGNSSVGGDLTVAGNTTLGDSSDDTLVVNATSSFNADVTIGSEDETANLYVNGDVTVTGDSDLQGDVSIGTLNSDGSSDTTLTVYSDADLLNDVTIGTLNDDGTSDNTLTVNSSSQFNNDVTIGTENDNSDLYVNGNETVTGDSSVGGNLSVDGDTDLGGNLTVAGSTTLGDSSGDTLEVNATTYFNSDVTIGSEDEAADLYVNGNATVTGDSDLQGDVSIGTLNSDGTTDTTLTVYSDADLLNDVTIGTLNDDGSSDTYLVVNSNTDFKNDVTMQKDLSVYGDTVIGDSSDDTLTVNATSDFKSDVTIGTPDETADLTVNGNATIGVLNEDGSSDSLLTVNAVSQFVNDVYIGSEEKNASLYINGDQYVSGNVTLGTLNEDGSSDTTLTVNSPTTFVNDVSMQSNLSVAQTLTVADIVVIGEDGIDMGNTSITNLAQGDVSPTSTDAITGAQLYQTQRSLTNDIKKAGAHAAALASLKPLDYDPFAPTSFSAGVGSYRGETAAAVGLTHYFNRDVMMNVGGTLGPDSKMLNASLSVRLGRDENESMSTENEKKKILADREERRQMKAGMEVLMQVNKRMIEDTMKMAAEIEELRKRTATPAPVPDPKAVAAMKADIKDADGIVLDRSTLKSIGDARRLKVKTPAPLPHKGAAKKVPEQAVAMVKAARAAGKLVNTSVEPAQDFRDEDGITLDRSTVRSIRERSGARPAVIPVPVPVKEEEEREEREEKEEKEEEKVEAEEEKPCEAIRDEEEGLDMATLRMIGRARATNAAQ